jgi:tetratricopeptide (TPR) repeat protein
LLGLLVTTPGTAQGDPADDSLPPELMAQAYYHFARGNLLDEQGDWEGALAAFQQALDLDPTNSLIYSEIAASYYRNGLFGDAVDYATRALSADRDNLDAYRLLVSVYTGMLQGTNEPEALTELVTLAVDALENVVRISPDDTEAYLMLGRLYSFSGEPDRAMDLYREFLRVEPSSLEGVIALAELQIGAGNAGEAALLLEGFLEGQPDADAALIALGEAYVQLDRPGEAVEVLQRAIDLGREEIELHSEVARLLLTQERWDEASEAYTALVDREPENPVYWYFLGQIERARMNYDAARTNLERAEQIAPGSDDIALEMAMLDRDTGQFRDAIVGLRSILESTARPRYTDAEQRNRQFFLTHIAILHGFLGEYEESVSAFEEMKGLVSRRDGTIDSYIVDAYRTAKEPERALEKAESALTVFPDNRTLHLQRADLLAETGRSDEAIRLLEEMIAEGDDEFDVYSGIVSIHEHAGNTETAEQLLDEMLDLFADEREQIYFLIGALHERQQRDDEAEAAFRSSLLINSDNAAVLNYLGYMLADNNERLEEALEMIQKAVEMDPTNGAYLDSLGWVYYQLDRLDLAEEYLKRAVLFSSTDPTLHEHLGDLYERTGRPDLARQSYMRSLDLAEDPEEQEQVRDKLSRLQSDI